ncbi:NtaA/DmoA family FMN-dependent monooxygenase [Agromyces atrinae]|uniref:FMN-dependent oxidoreductase (Nitrilotriacetate monooxygenase family) n=1 Tax=Agromyces atrinae TaxID=592376 RepID=A0A4Q2M6D4_9MICO|nr:NtaA/DmoA family FMN-dependent monooxygenase [Agromyces atrinae]NYD67302.1 FMN-dependent oxidoreductase (nitrilotriacetate monooxygenase family) [Agromyces atrinae]RXZ86867.1 LLM class flavin-dependent oxidoreductase [Agromyces atrinae]
MSTAKRQVHLAAHFPGVNNTTVWTDPRSESQVEFSSFEHFAKNAERGFFDYLFLAEGLRLREHKGRIHDLDVVGRPNTLAILAAVAAVTEHIGLVGTLSSTFNEPYELARALSSLDHLSNGRAGWNVVTSSDAFHGANFRRGGFLEHSERYTRADEFVSLAKEWWDSWRADAVAADAASGRFLSSDDAIGEVVHRGRHFDVAGRFTTPRSPQGYPVIVQAGDSPDGRDFAAHHAEVIFSLHTEFEDAQAFYADVKGRLPGRGRTEDSLKILPAVGFVIGDTAADAAERAREVELAQVSGQTAIAFLEQVWGRDLTAYDPEGPLPDVEPDIEGQNITRGRVRHVTDIPGVVAAWRQKAEAENLSIRDLVISLSSRRGFVGTPDHIASEIDRYVQSRATDGFVVVGTTNPYGLDEFVDRVVPLLQERGVYRTEYPEGATLRENLGLPALESDAEEARHVG